MGHNLHVYFKHLNGHALAFIRPRYSNRALGLRLLLGLYTWFVNSKVCGETVYLHCLAIAVAVKHFCKHFCVPAHVHLCMYINVV